MKRTSFVISILFITLALVSCGKTDEERLIDDGYRGKALRDELKNVQEIRAKIEKDSPKKEKKPDDIFDKFYKTVSPLLVDEVEEPA